MSKSKAVRFSDKEHKNIEKFLKKNTFLDFSTLARLAIDSFIKNPDISINKISDKK